MTSGSRFGAAFGKVSAYLASHGVQPDGPAIALYRRSGEGFEVEAGFYAPPFLPPGDGVSVVELPAGEAVVTVHIGPYETLSEAYEAIGT